MIDFLREQECDILLFQEVDRNHSRSGDRDIAALIGKALGMEVYFSPALENENTAYGNAILSKTPLENCRTITLGPFVPQNNFDNENRVAAYATIRLNDEIVRIICTHLATSHGLPNAHRREQVEILAKEISQEKTPLLLGGDFNIEVSSSDLEPLNRVVQNLTPGIGPTCMPFDREEFIYAIDRFYGNGINVIGFQNIPRVDLSDHCLILGDFQIS